jgi:hypothetical protein
LSLWALVTGRTRYGIFAITINFFDGYSTEEGGFQYIHVVHGIVVSGTRWRGYRLSICRYCTPIARKCKATFSVSTLEHISGGTWSGPFRDVIDAFAVQSLPRYRAVEEIGGIAGGISRKFG